MGNFKYNSFEAQGGDEGQAAAPERDIEEAGDTANEQNSISLDKLFAIDQEKDIDDIKCLMRRLRKIPGERFGSEYSYKSDKERGWLKYSDEEVDNAQWSAEDLDFVVEELKQERIGNYFRDISKGYPERLSVVDSIVRRDQELEITEELRDGKPVLIRGTWRIGKSSMLLSLANHKFGKENSLFVTATDERIAKDATEYDFINHFGKGKISNFIAGKKLPAKESDNLEGYGKRLDRQNEIGRLISESGKDPFEYLNDFLAERNETVFLAVDEAANLGEHPAEFLEYLASLKNFSQLRIAVVLHRLAEFDEVFPKIFEGYKTHFMRALSIEETGDLIRRPLEGTPINFDDEAVQKIFEFTGGRPMEIHNVCHALMDQLSKLKSYKITYRADDIEKIIKSDFLACKNLLRLLSIPIGGRTNTR